MTTVQKYWFDRLMDGNMRPPSGGDGIKTYGAYSHNADGGDWSGEIRVDHQFQDYLSFAEDMKDRFPLCEQQFGLSLKKMCRGIQKKRLRMNGERVHFKIFPPLEECRAEFQEMVKMDIAWNEDIE